MFSFIARRMNGVVNTRDQRRDRDCTQRHRYHFRRYPYTSNFTSISSHPSSQKFHSITYPRKFFFSKYHPNSTNLDPSPSSFTSVLTSTELPSHSRLSSKMGSVHSSLVQQSTGKNMFTQLSCRPNEMLY